MSDCDLLYVSLHRNFDVPRMPPPLGSFAAVLLGLFSSFLRSASASVAPLLMGIYFACRSSYRRSS